MYRERKDAMIDALGEYLPQLRWTNPNGGFYVWVTMPDVLDSKPMLPRAVKELVAYTPGTAFFADGRGRHAMRLSFCYPTPEAIRVGIRRLATVVNGELDLLDTFAGTGTLQLPTERRLRLRPAFRPQVVEKPLIMSDSSGLYVVVLAGGISHERDVSLRSGRRVADALIAAGHRVVLRDPDAGLLPSSRRSAPTWCCPPCTARAARTASLLGLLRVPRRRRRSAPTGAAARRAWDKPAAKLDRRPGRTLGARVDHAVARGVPRARRRERPARGARRALEGDLVVKPAPAARPRA